jgi:L-ascorbate metabolism protein UlaG (beta-lactamase superfamily)
VKEPFLKDDAFLAALKRPANGPRLWWLGQSGFLVESQGRRLLFDPYLSDSLTEKYFATARPHVRVTARVVGPERLDFIDVVTSSHRHTDHLDGATLMPLRAVNPTMRMILPEANRSFAAERLGCEPEWFIGVDDGWTVDVCGFRVHGIASAHEKVDRDEAGRCLYLGYVVEFDGYCIYHPGDCVLYDGLVEKLKPFGVDVALLPINGTLPERRVAGNFWGSEAAWLAHEIQARLAIPMHYDMFEFNTEPPDDFVASCRSLGQECVVLEQGQGLEISQRVPRH